ncbi:isopeptide-forming domain-containing fimbrial protein [Collinsella aerofaciens]|uniref:isopeptide-forming domain-containing fimbrial protein n=1 Tax=Collinsella aerofaciens TaxID=74426 RepID=UPI00359C6287
MNENIARLAVTAGLTAALSFGGVMAPVTMAFAEGDNTITITQSEGNASTKFQAYQIFKADVVDPTEEGTTGKIVSNVSWAAGVDQNVQNAIINAIKADSEYQTSDPKLPDKVTAQDVADWLTKNVTGTTAETVVDKDHLLNKIAGIVRENVTATGESFAAGSPFTATSNGYYLFLTDPVSIGTKEDYSNKKQTGTSPIFAVVGGDAVTVAEKTDIPTVEKKIMDDKPGSAWADKGDSQMGQSVQYQLTGTVAKNVDTFNTYYYQFRDELSAGLTADLDSVKVTVDGAKIAADEYAVAYDQENVHNLLTVTFDNLKSSGATVTPNSKIVVTYTAKLDPNKAQNVVVGGEGNKNTVKLVYSNNPGHDSKGESVPDTVRDYTYALKLVKEDSASKTTKLEGVRFTIRATGADEGTGTQFVQQDGSLGSDAHEFATDAKGEINIKGLDAGTYTVKETHTLDGYNTLPDFTFTIKAEGLGRDEGNNDLNVTVSKDGSDLVVTPSFEDGTVNLTVKNKKGSGLPLTGLNGVTFTWIAGGAVLCIGVAHLIRSRKQAEESEQE